MDSVILDIVDVLIDRIDRKYYICIGSWVNNGWGGYYIHRWLER